MFESRFHVHTLVNIGHKLNVRKMEFTQQIAFSDICQSYANDFNFEITENNIRSADFERWNNWIIITAKNQTKIAAINKQEKTCLFRALLQILSGLDSPLLREESSKKYPHKVNIFIWYLITERHALLKQYVNTY